MENFTKIFDHREFHFDSSIMSYAGIMGSLVDEYSGKFKFFLLESNSIPLAIEHLKHRVSNLRSSAISRDFDRKQLGELAKELGIDSTNYLDSINNLRLENSPFKDFIQFVHRDNYLEESTSELAYAYLNESNVYTQDLRNKPHELYIIKDLLDYVHIKTYLSALNKLDQVIDNIIPNSIPSYIPTASTTKQPNNLQKDKTQLEGYQLAFLLYLYVKQFGIDSLKNSHHVFASYFFQMLYGDLGELSNQIANDLSMNERNKKNTFDFLKEINRITPLSPESSPFLRKYFDKIEGQSFGEIVNLPDRKNKVLEASFASEIRWSQIKRSSSCAFNLAKKVDKNWTFKSNKFDLYISILKRTYPTLMTDQINKQSNLFKAECLNYYV